jgi:hypothetical protein
MRTVSITVVWIWILGCGPVEHGSVDGDESKRPDPAEQPDPADQKACDDWRRLDCPSGLAPRMFDDRDNRDDLVFFEMEDVAQSVCGGRGTFIDAADIEGADHVGYLITHNTACTFGCFGPCDASRGDICITEYANGDPCFTLCEGPIGEEQCLSGAQACDQDVACEG